MLHIPQNAPLQPEIDRLRLLVDSYHRLTGKDLIPPVSDHALRQTVWLAPCVIVAHGTEEEPIFFYGNKRALELFEFEFDAFIKLPSSHSAEPAARESRTRLLNRVSLNGYVDDYSGIRISSSGKRFRIEQTTVWNLLDAQGRLHGQAAAFSHWSPS